MISGSAGSEAIRVEGQFFRTTFADPRISVAISLVLTIRTIEDSIAEMIVVEA